MPFQLSKRNHDDSDIFLYLFIYYLFIYLKSHGADNFSKTTKTRHLKFTDDKSIHELASLQF